jgi:ubiquinone/menaquinone biosynthesis C-methylase UbiE
MDCKNKTTLHSIFLICNAFNERNSRLYYTVDKTLSKPFNFKNSNHKILYAKLKNEIIKLVENNSDDYTILNHIHKFLNLYLYPIDKYPNNENDDRADNRVDDIGRLISGISNSIPVHNFLDIGCSEGGITAKLGEYFGLDHSNIIGIDIRKPKSTDGFTFIQTQSENQKIPMDDNSVCFITALMVLHHTYDPENLLNEIYRVLKPGGIFLIREHDIDGNNDNDGKTFLDILHGLYSVSWAKEGYQENPDFCDNYYAVYRSRDNWTKMIEEYKLKLVTENSDLQYFYNYCKVKREYNKFNWIKNPYHFYYAVYQK